MAATAMSTLPTPSPTPNKTIAMTIVTTAETPFARIAAAGGAPPPCAMPGANACHYLNFTWKGQDWDDKRTSSELLDESLRYAVEASLKHIEASVEDLSWDV